MKGQTEPPHWVQQIRDLGLSVRSGEPLSEHTTMRIGGPADAFVQVPDRDQLEQLTAFEGKIPVMILGRGSNVLVSDEGFRGIVVELVGEFRRLVRQGKRMCAGAGVSLPRLAKFAAREGLRGLEFALGVPGSVGGGLIMNAGAWGQQLSDTVTEIEVITLEGEYKLLSPQEAAFGYRQSALGRYFAVTCACFQGDPGDPKAITRHMQELYDRKIATQPFVEQNAGCMFRNPPGDSAGRLIDQCGLKGTRVGDAAVSTKHANFLVNHGHATAADVLELVRRIRHTVRREMGVTLELEVKLIGFDPSSVRDLLPAVP